jgi:TolA-binding protein
MRDTKTSLLLVLSLFLLSLSLVLLSIWGYNFYFSNQSNTIKTDANTNLSASGQKTNAIRDSLQKIYASTITKLDSRIDSTKNAADSVIGNVDNNLSEINKLKEEIAIILKKNNSIEDLGTAREKIDELQQKVEQLRNRNLDVEKENKRLNALLAQLTNNKEDVDENSKRPNSINKLVSEKTIPVPPFIASDLHLTALMVGDNDAEKETTEADETEKIAGSFIVQNKNNQNKTADIMVVVLQPNGKVLQNSIWETGTFDTPEGKKIYSHKMHFECSKGEAKRLLFSLVTDKFERGNYIVQIYYNGAVIGRMVKSLS